MKVAEEAGLIRRCVPAAEANKKQNSSFGSKGECGCSEGGRINRPDARIASGRSPGLEKTTV